MTKTTIYIGYQRFLAFLRFLKKNGKYHHLYNNKRKCLDIFHNLIYHCIACTYDKCSLSTPTFFSRQLPAMISEVLLPRFKVKERWISCIATLNYTTPVELYIMGSNGKLTSDTITVYSETTKIYPWTECIYGRYGQEYPTDRIKSIGGKPFKRYYKMPIEAF